MNAAAETATRISVGPLTWVKPVKDFQKWMQSAQPGARVVYASGPQLPQTAATVLLVREYIAAKLIDAHHVRAEAHGGWDFVAVRVRSGAGKVAREAQEAAGEETPEARLLRWLRRCTNMGLVCPTNAEVAAALDVTNPAYLFRKLREAGLIDSIDPGAGMRRVVTICATGKRTRGGAL